MSGQRKSVIFTSLMHLLNKMVLLYIEYCTYHTSKATARHFLLLCVHIIALAFSLRVASSRPDNSNASVLSGFFLCFVFACLAFFHDECLPISSTCRHYNPFYLACCY